MKTSEMKSLLSVRASGPNKISGKQALVAALWFSYYVRGQNVGTYENPRLLDVEAFKKRLIERLLNVPLACRDHLWVDYQPQYELWDILEDIGANPHIVLFPSKVRMYFDERPGVGPWIEEGDGPSRIMVDLASGEGRKLLRKRRREPSCFEQTMAKIDAELAKGKGLSRNFMVSISRSI